MALAVLLLLGLTACRPTTPTGPATRAGAGSPLEVHNVALPRDEAGHERSLSFVLVDPARWHVKVVAARRREEWQTAAAVAQATRAVAVLNGGYFDTHDRPMGWLVAGGRQINPPGGRDWPVLLVRGPRVEIRPAAEARQVRDAREVLQCGPRLVAGARPTQLKDSPRRARSAVGLNQQGHLVLAATTTGGLTLAELAGVLARPPQEGGPGCQVAMNLDGGPSTQFAVPGALDVPGAYPMPAHLAVLPRSTP